MLTFILKKEWYDKIKSGEKTIEYREIKPYWTSRLNSALQLDNCLQNEGDWIEWLSSCMPRCRLRFGYTNQYLLARIREIEIINGKDTDLAIDKPVCAIYLSDIEEV